MSTSLKKSLHENSGNRKRAPAIFFAEHSQTGIGPTVIIRKLDFEHARTQQLHDGSHLSAPEFAFGQIFRQRHNIKKLNLLFHFLRQQLSAPAILPCILWQKELESTGLLTFLVCSHLR